MLEFFHSISSSGSLVKDGLDFFLLIFLSRSVSFSVFLILDFPKGFISSGVRFLFKFIQFLSKFEIKKRRKCT